MIIVLVIMAFGMLLGVVLRKNKKIIKVNNKSTIWIIFVLLFFMGVSVGKNNDIMNNLSTIGLRGLQLSLAAVLGSVVCAWVVFLLFFKNGNGLNKNKS